MAKQSLFGEGKGRIEATSHIRSSTNFNGGQSISKPVAFSPLNTPDADVSGRPQGNAPATDSPVPTGTQKPDLAVRSKAAESSRADTGSSFPSGGVLGRS